MTDLDELQKALDAFPKNPMTHDVTFWVLEVDKWLEGLRNQFLAFLKEYDGQVRKNAVRIEQIKNEKDTKIEALQLAILSIYKPEIEKLKRNNEEKVLLDRKQLSEDIRLNREALELVSSKDVRRCGFLAGYISAKKELLEASK